VTASGQTVDADAIVLATGFETSRYLAGIEVIGEGGQELHERWGDDPQAYLGVAVSGFPNFFMLYGPNTNQGGNFIVYVLGRIVTQWPYTEQDYERETRALRPGDRIHRHASATGRSQPDVHASGGEPS
jgi:cation diffusion facilitator CzcD-associated flavoprotein CzcO